MRILLIEDEQRTASLLQEMIEQSGSGRVVKICASVEESVAYLSQHQDDLDLVFMDVQLADGESFEIFELLDIRKPVIFCTAYDDYLLQAFKHNGIDYILKPFSQAEVERALLKLENLKKSLSHAQTGLQQPLDTRPKTYQSTFLIRFREKMIPLAVSDIAYVSHQQDLNIVFKHKGEQALIFKSLEEIEQLLNPADFFRINRQILLNRSAIKDIEPYLNRKLIVNLHFPTPEKLIVSRLKVTAFREWLES